MPGIMITRATWRDGLFTMLIWASAFPAIRQGLKEYPPKDLILLRFTTASIVLFLMCLRRERKWPERRDLPRFLLLGFLGITVYQLSLNYGQLTVPSGTASLIINTAPLWAALFSWLQLRERIGKRQVFGLALGFLGIATITLGQNRTIGMGRGLALVGLGALAHSGSFIVQKPLLEKYSPLTVTAFTVLFGVLPLAPWAHETIAVVRQAHAATTLTVLYLGLFPAAVAYVFWNRVVSQLPVSRAASFLYLVPPFSFFMAWIWHREIPTAISLLGGVIALAGVALALSGGGQPGRDSRGL